MSLVKLGEICDFFNGGAWTQSEFTETGYPVLKVSNCKNSGFEVDDVSFIPPEIAQKSGGTVAVEDLPRTCLGRDTDELCKLVSADDRLRVCFDMNHLLYDDNVEFIKALGEKIITVHVSDYDFTNERHWLPGEGKNPWDAIYNGLKEVGYNGVWMYELGFKSPRTLTRSRDLDFSDFYNNAMEIMSGKPLTVVPGEKHPELL